MFATGWCGHCHRLKRNLQEEGIAVRVVDVDEDPTAADRIIAKTGGFRTVPTLEVRGELYVNPSPSEVKALLADTPT